MQSCVTHNPQHDEIILWKALYCLVMYHWMKINNEWFCFTLLKLLAVSVQNINRANTKRKGLQEVDGYCSSFFNLEAASLSQGCIRRASKNNCQIFCARLLTVATPMEGSGQNKKKYILFLNKKKNPHCWNIVGIKMWSTGHH